MVNLGVAAECSTFQQRKKTKVKKSAEIAVSVPKKTTPAVWEATEETAVIDLAQPRRRVSKQHTLAAAQKAQFVQPTKSKPIKAQVSEEVTRTKRRKQVFYQSVPNTRLYQPTPPRYRRIEPPSTSKPAAKLPRTYVRPRPGAAFTVFDNLTDHIQTGQKRKIRSNILRKISPLRIQLQPVQETTGRKSLVINVPAVNLLYESSPERSDVLHGKHSSPRKSPIFTHVRNTLSSPDKLSEAGDHEFKDHSKTGSHFHKSSANELSPAGSSELNGAIASTSSLFQAYINGYLNPSPNRKDVTAIIPETQKAKVKRDEAKNTGMSNKDRGSQHSTSPEDFSDGNESLSAPSEFLAEFLSAIMQRKYVSALKYCKLILQYEPNNVTAKEFYPLLEEKLKTADKEEGSSGAELHSAENPPTDISGDSNQNTEEKEDEGLSYNSDDSYVLDDELEEEGEELEDAGAAGGADSPLTSSQSSGRRATDSDRSLPSSAGVEGETDNSNNLSGSGYEDEDSSKYEMDDDNGNAVSVSARYLSANAHSAAVNANASPGAAAAGARFVCEGNDNDTASGDVTASNDNYRKNQEELRRHKIQQMRSQYVHEVK